MVLDVFTFGETMLRLSPPNMARMEGTTNLEVAVGGTESNVAIALSRLGKSAAWMSRLPDSPMGRMVANTIRQHGVDTHHVIWSDGDDSETERLGLVFLEHGSPPRPTQVWYDRKHSAASKMTPDDLPAETIAEARWLHLTGITPALSDSCRETVETALDLAQLDDVTISFDVNYRAKLWSPKDAAKTLHPFCEMADIVFIAARDARNLFGLQGNLEALARGLQRQWSGTVVVTDSTNDKDKGIVGYDGVEHATAPIYPVTIVDRIGAGDAFAAGVICKWLEHGSLGECLQFGAATAALKLTIRGDFALITRPEVEALLADNTSIISR